MATVYLEFNPLAAIFPSSDPASIIVNQGNYPIGALVFDDGTNSTAPSAFFQFRAVEYGSGNLTLDIEWYADTASSGDVVFGASIAVITPNTDSDDIETNSMATVNTVTDSHLGTTGQRLHRATITISNLDSLTTDDFVTLRVYRDSDNGSDNLSGNVFVTLVTLSYSDT